MIYGEFGVRYHPAHVSVCSEAKVDLAKNRYASRPAGEEAIRRWKEERWPKLKRA